MPFSIRQSVLKKSYLAQFFDVMFAELDYICPSNTLRCPGKKYHNNDVSKAMSDIALVCPAKIMDRHGKIHQSFQYVALGF